MSTLSPQNVAGPLIHRRRDTQTCLALGPDAKVLLNNYRVSLMALG